MLEYDKLLKPKRVGISRKGLKMLENDKLLKPKLNSRKKKNNGNKIKPFLKWAGGKLRIVEILKKRFPKTGKRFIEPFLGAGAVSLNVDYPLYIVNDVNPDLMLVWNNFKIMGMDFVEKCKKLFSIENNNRDVFNRLKKEFNNTNNKLRKATLFVYLNRHCFNGLCRYNGSGEYNVPFGKYEKPYFPSNEFEKSHEKVNKFQIYNKDFRDIFDLVRKDDVVYCDPPYLPMSESASFNSYSTGGFSLKDQIELAQCAEIAARQGAVVIVSNHSNWYSRQIYTNLHKGKISTIQVSRTISSKTNKRNSVGEIIAVFNKETL